MAERRVTEVDEFMRELLAEFPRFRIVAKRSSALSKLIDALLRIVTLGGQKVFMTRYHTVIGDTLYVPDCWESTPELDRVILLRHERVHLRQRRKLTFLGMAFIYLVPWFPLGLAYGRARLEWEAYTETLRATAELKGLDAARDPVLRDHIIARFTGPDYGWMWPFEGPLRRWYSTVLRDIEAEHATSRPETNDVLRNRQ